MISIAAWPMERKRQDNPYSALLADGLRANGFGMTEFWRWEILKRHDVLIVHWPESGLDRQASDWARGILGLGTLCVLRLQKLLGANVVWVAHNVTPRQPRERGLLRWIGRHLDRTFGGVIAPSEWSAQQALRLGRVKASTPIVVVPHGPYHVDGSLSRREADDWRRTVATEADFLILHFGQVREYKGVGRMLDAFMSTEDNRLRLHISGRCNDPLLSAAVHESSMKDKRVTYELEHISQERLLSKIIASDLICLPYETIDNSGSLLLALSAGRPVLAPRVGAIPEIQAMVGEDWIRLFDGAISGECISGAVGPPPSGDPNLDWCAWGETMPVLADWIVETTRANSRNRR